MLCADKFKKSICIVILDYFTPIKSSVNYSTI